MFVFCLRSVQMIQMLLTVGDFDFQASIIEILLRLYVRKDLEAKGREWFPGRPEVMEGIIMLKDCNFEQV